MTLGRFGAWGLVLGLSLLFLLHPFPALAAPPELPCLESDPECSTSEPESGTTTTPPTPTQSSESSTSPDPTPEPTATPEPTSTPEPTTPADVVPTSEEQTGDLPVAPLQSGDTPPVQVVLSPDQWAQIEVALAALVFFTAVGTVQAWRQSA